MCVEVVWATLDGKKHVRVRSARIDRDGAAQLLADALQSQPVPQ